MVLHCVLLLQSTADELQSVLLACGNHIASGMGKVMSLNSCTGKTKQSHK